jgi:NitT/TauT family transport system ATP-binding protein
MTATADSAERGNSAAAVGLAVEGLSVRYPGGRGVVALEGTSLRVAEGSFHAILGPSGCGKSTLLKALAGLVPIASGSIELPGDETFAYVPQGNSCFPWLRAEENVAYGLKVRGVAKGERIGRARELLDDLGLGAFARHFPAQLSEGMRQRVSIARAFAVDAPLLLMDEPLSALDFQTKIAVQRELVTLWEKRRCTVLYVTHDIDEALALADDVSVLSGRPGRVLETVRVPFARPRGYETIREHPEYPGLFRRLYSLLEPQ